MNKLFRTLGSALAIGGLIFTSTSCDKEDDMDPTPQPQQMNIAQTAQDNGNFTILVDALTRTGLLPAVSDENANLTVFAPTDAAFGDLLTELNLPDLDAVENALGTEGLKNILLYHVLGMEVKSDMVSTGFVSTLGVNGSNDPLSIYISAGSKVMINDRAEVVIPDVDASNGVIHAIDKVILPQTIFELLKLDPNYSSLVAALMAADGDLDALLMDAMSGPNTVFAPNNDAFDDLLVELQLSDLTELVNTLGTDGVADVLLYHVVAGNVNSDEVPTGMVATVNGENISIAINNGVEITDANGRMSTVTQTDIQGVNGVIHFVGKVLLP